MPVNILMPALSPTMTEGTLAKWLKKEGDTVKAGEVIAEIETDKATMEVEAVDEGKLAKILIPAGTSNVAVNTAIAVLLEDGEDASALSAAPVAAIPSPQPSPEGRGGGGATPPPPSPSALPPPPGGGGRGEGQRVFASPLARRIAEQKGLDLKSVKGTGPHGRIVKSDVENAKASGTTSAPKSSSALTSSGPDAKQLISRYDRVGLCLSQ